MLALREIVAEIEAAAQQEAAGIAILETTRFDPELDRVAMRCLPAAKRRAEALAAAARLLSHPVVASFPGLPPQRGRA